MCQSPLPGCILPLAPRSLSLARNTPGALTNHIAEPVKGMLPKWFWSTRRQKALWFSCMMDKHAVWQRRHGLHGSQSPPLYRVWLQTLKMRTLILGACSCTQASPTPAPGQYLLGQMCLRATHQPGPQSLHHPLHLPDHYQPSKQKKSFLGILKFHSCQKVIIKKHHHNMKILAVGILICWIYPEKLPGYTTWDINETDQKVPEVLSYWCPSMPPLSAVAGAFALPRAAVSKPKRPLCKYPPSWSRSRTCVINSVRGDVRAVLHKDRPIWTQEYCFSWNDQ